MKTILIVEDHEDYRFALSTLIKCRFDCDIVETSNGMEALHVLRRHDHLPDLIISDLMMPKMGGLELIQEVRRDEAFKWIPIIICSSRYEMRRETARLGASGFVEKKDFTYALPILISGFLGL